MSDLIDRQELYHEMTVKSMELFENGLAWHEFRRGFNFAMEFVQEAPSAKPEQKKEKWIIHDYAFGRERYECSRCRERCDLEYKFCPNCGTRMEIRNNE